MNNTKNNLLDFTYISSNNKIIGEFHLNGLSRISSNLEGNLFLDESGSISIEPNGSIKGVIKGAKKIDIYGFFEGKIYCSGKITIHSSAKVYGELFSPQLEILPGSIVNTECICG